MQDIIRGQPRRITTLSVSDAARRLWLASFMKTLAMKYEHVPTSHIIATLDVFETYWEHRHRTDFKSSNSSVHRHSYVENICVKFLMRYNIRYRSAQEQAVDPATHLQIVCIFWQRLIVPEYHLSR